MDIHSWNIQGRSCAAWLDGARDESMDMIVLQEVASVHKIHWIANVPGVISKRCHLERATNFIDSEDLGFRVLDEGLGL